MTKVYIYTSPSGKQYCGITSQTLAERAKHAGKGYKNCPAFWHAIEKYGFDTFKVEIYGEYESEDEAKMIERQIIAERQLQDKRFGYNIADGGDGPPHDDETKAKIKQTILEKYGTENYSQTQQHLDEVAEAARLRQIKKADGKKVILYTIDNKVYQIFDCISDASLWGRQQRGEIQTKSQKRQDNYHIKQILNKVEGRYTWLGYHCKWSNDNVDID